VLFVVTNPHKHGGGGKGSMIGGGIGGGKGIAGSEIGGGGGGKIFTVWAYEIAAKNAINKTLILYVKINYM